MINNSEFLLGEIQKINPWLNEYEYIEYWRSIKRRIFEGERVGGKWMPGPLWYGCNFHRIPLEEAEGNQSYGNVFVRDIDWPIYYYYEEARGFSGFSHSTKSCNRLLLEDYTDEQLLDQCYFKGVLNQKLYDNLFLPTGSRKEYVSAKEELARLQSDCGKAVYYNNAQNFMTMGSRGFGKCQSPETPIRVRNGWTTMEDVKVGDLIYGGNGKLTKVIFKTDLQKNLKYYEIKLDDGRSVKACEDHLWRVYDYETEEYTVLSTKVIFGTPEYQKKYSLPVNGGLSEEDNTEELNKSYKWLLDYKKKKTPSLYLVNTKAEDTVKNLEIIRILGLWAKKISPGTIEIRPNLTTVDITSIEPTDNSDGYCIQVDNDDHTYITKDYIVTHNTVVASVLCNHNILTDGMTDYDLYLQNQVDKKIMRSTTLVSSQENKYVSQIKDYIKAALEQYPGAFTYGQDTRPSPLQKSYTGSWDKNNESGIKFSSSSSLIWRVFGDNSFSANSGRPNLSIVDEFAFVKNIKDILGSIEGADASKKRKNNVIWMQATGGYAKGDTVRYAESLFYNPKAFNFMEFEDIHENRGNIGYFVSALEGSMAYKKGVNLETDLLLATQTERKKREDKKKDRDALQSYIVNHPLVPSECFLLGDNNIFPATALKEQYASLMEGGINHLKLDQSFKGRFKKNIDGTVEFEATTDQPIREYPLINSNEFKMKGCVEMFQKPETDVNGNIPRNRYIAGADVVRNDDPGESESLPSLIIMDRNTRQIVLEYTGRTNNTKDFYEQVMLAMLYYNARVMYEQNIKDMFNYFDQRKCLHLLADTPYQLRSKEDNGIRIDNTTKGINNQGRAIIDGGIKFTNSWFMERSFTDNTKYQIDHIYSPAILLEAIKYNGSINCDRLSSIFMLMWFDETENQERLKENAQKKADFQSEYLEFSRKRKIIGG